MKKNIIIALVSISLIFLAGGIYIISNIQSSTSTLDYLIKLHQVEILREHLLLQIKRVQSDLSLWKTAHSRDIDTVIANVDRMGKLSETCFDCHHAPAVVQRLNSLVMEIERYKSAFSRSLTMRAKRERVQAESDLAFHISEKLTSEVRSMVHMTASKLYGKTETSLKEINRSKTILYVLVILTPFCAAGLGFIVIRELTAPIKILLRATRKIKGGDLDFRVEGLQDEYGELARSFNEMAETLKQNMHEIRESEKRYRVLFDGAGDAIFLIEGEGENLGSIVEANRAAAKMHGYTVEELLKMNLIRDIDTPQAAEKAAERAERIMAGEWVQAEISHVKKDGTVFPVEINAGLLEFMGRKYILGIDRDISERKKMENQILQSKLDWEDTFNTITDMITIHDKDYNIIRANRSAVEALGLDISGETKSKCFEVFHGSPSAPENCLSCECYKTGAPASFEIFEPHLGKFLEVRAMPRVSDDSRMVGLIHVIRDITERKRTEEALQRAEQMKLVGEWAAGLAHEIKNPLAGIKVSVEVLLEEMSLSDEDRAVVLRAVGEIKRIETLLKSLLNFAKPPKLEFASVSLNELLDQTIAFSMKHPSIAANLPVKVKVVKDFDESIPVVKADAVQMQQVFLNLLFNAIEAMPDGGTLFVRTFCEREGDALHIEISDTGKGIEKDQIDNVFKPFFTSKPKGSGLGLAISRRIVEEHGGSISVVSTPGESTVFKIDLKTQQPTRVI